jgi:hypothetical protein
MDEPTIQGTLLIAWKFNLSSNLLTFYEAAEVICHKIVAFNELRRTDCIQILFSALKKELQLHEAVIKNDTDAVRRVLREPLDVNSRNNVSIPCRRRTKPADSSNMELMTFLRNSS